MWKGLAPPHGVHLFPSPRLGAESRGPQGRAPYTSSHLSRKQLPRGRTWGKKHKFLVAEAHTFHADSLPSWAFCSGVTPVAFPWTPSKDFGILVLVFLNPNAEFQLWAHQLSPDYVLSVCQASFLI